MANPTTAAEWKTVAANILDQIKRNDTAIAELRTQRATLGAQIDALVTRRDSTLVDRAAIQAQINALLSKQIEIDNRISELVSQNLQLTNEYNEALRQAAIAESGPPNVNENTPPVTITPNQSATTVPPPVPPVIVTSAPPTVAQDDGATIIPTIIPVTEPPVAQDDATGVDAAVERQQASEPVLAEDGSVATGIARNTETGEIYYTTAPVVTQADEFAGIDDQVKEQKDIQDGSLEFAGIDDQVAANENTLKEPPLLSDDEVEAALKPPKEEKVNPDIDDNTNQGTTAPKDATIASKTAQDANNEAQQGDWRVRLSLASGANYLYKDPDVKERKDSILFPLIATNGVIFPYTPSISVAYAAHYDSQDLIHSNYKVYQYKSSSVDTFTITCDFTAQDTAEANYLLAVIHFFRSVTKMFYGKDQDPAPGIPPPLCYITGLGQFQFEQHPIAVTGFTYTLPTEVDYIRAGTQLTAPGIGGYVDRTVGASRLQTSGLAPGAASLPPQFKQVQVTKSAATYVPTKMQISITAVPIVSRNAISNEFSLKKYATGELLKGSTNPSKGGIW